MNRYGQKKEKVITPVATAKPVRGREMISKAVPSAEKVSKGESLTSGTHRPREAKAEVYHEGYIDGKLYLVPDSNLEAMKDIVNFKMMPRRSIRYKHQTSYEISDYDHFRSKLHNLLDKINEMSSEENSESDETLEEEPEEEEEMAEDKEIVEEEESKDEQVKEDEEDTIDEEEPEEEGEHNLEKVMSEEDDGEGKEKISLNDEQSEDESEGRDKEERLSSIKDKSGEEIEEENFPKDEPVTGERFIPVHENEIEAESEGVKTGKIGGSETESGSDIEHGKELTAKPWPEPKDVYKTIIPKDDLNQSPKSSHEKHKTHSESDGSCIRFLISGHIKKSKKPIYIIQEYNGDSLFKGQNKDIFTSEKSGDIDILIAGKFYEENILEEANGKPIALNTKPNKIIIDENRSKVFEDYFEDVFNMKTADIFVKGQFITNETTNKVTPFLRLGVRRRSP